MTTRHIRHTFRNLRYAAAALLLCGALAGCSKEMDMGPEAPPAEPPAVTGGELSLSISVPGVAAPQSYALGATQEGAVQRELLHVLFFASDGGTADADFRYIDRLTPDEKQWGASQAGTSGNYRQNFRVGLPLKADGTNYAKYRAMIVSNIDEVQMALYDDQLAGSTIDKARTLIRFEHADGTVWNTGTGEPATGFTPLPLWGESSPFTAQAASVKTIPLLRAVARIDVGVNLTGKNLDQNNKWDGTYDLDNINGQDMDLPGHTFEIRSVRLYNAARGGHLAPAEGNYDKDKHKATAATVDQATPMHTTEPHYTAGGTAKNMLRRQIYLPETKNKGVDNDDDAFYIVVGGSYNGGAESFYRIDFYDRTGANGGTAENEQGQVKPSGQNRYDILRNHAYVINILRVRGEGYATAELAAASEPINMEIEIRSWDQGDNMGNVVTDGQYRLSVSATQMQYHQDGTAQELKVFTDYLLAGNAAASGWKMSIPNAADKAALIFYDQTGQVIPEADWAKMEVSEGIANKTGVLRVGLTRYTEDLAGDQMERTVTLRFTAGRMTQDVELMQDVLSTVSLSLSPEKMSFTRNPKSGQFVTAKPSPAENVTLYVSWEDAAGNTVKYNISDTSDPANAGITLPAGFTDDADDKGRRFFEQSASGGNIFQLLPNKWDAEQNGGKDPAAPRMWRFTVTAEWPGGSTASRVLEVEQSNWQLTWELWDRQGGSQITTPVYHRVSFPAEGGTQTPYVYTGGNVLKWYFASREMTEGNYSGVEWLEQWREMGNKDYTGNASLTLTVPANPEIADRVMRLQAASDQDGFDRTTSYMEIHQAGGALVLEPEGGTGTNVASFYQDPNDQKRYVLDFGPVRAATFKAVNVRANTDWWWELITGASDDLPGAGIAYTTPLHIGQGHPYYKAYFSSEDKSIIAAGIGNATTGNSDKNSTTKVWTTAFSWRSLQLPWLSTTAVSDEALTKLNPKLPLAGDYYVDLKLRNTHDQLDPTGDADRIDAASRTVRVQRTIPSLWHISQWPLNGWDYMNLGNFPAWATENLAFNTNTALKWEITRDGQVVDQGDFTPLQGYESHSIGSILSKKAVVPAANYVDFTKDKVTWVLTVSGSRQTAQDKEDEPFSLQRTYYTGYEMNIPLTTNLSRGSVMSYEGGEILLDFSNSTYHDAQQVRIVRQTYDTDGNPVAGSIQYETYTLDGSKGQRYIKVTVPFNSSQKDLFAYWAEYIPYGQTEWSPVFHDGTMGPDTKKFLFIQDAMMGSAQKVLGKTPAALPNLDQLNAGGGVVGRLYETVAGYSGLYFKFSILDGYRSRTCKLTGYGFRAAFPIDRSVVNGPNDWRAGAYVDEYKTLYGKDVSVCVNLIGRFNYNCTTGVTGQQWYHPETITKNVLTDDGGRNGWPSQFGCNGTHGVTNPWKYITGTSARYVDQNGRESAAMTVLYVRDPATIKPGTPATVNSDFMGTKQ